LTDINVWIINNATIHTYMNSFIILQSPKMWTLQQFQVD
jgi:hypothetical protein